MYQFFPLFSICILSFFPGAEHPYHVSVCEIQHAAKIKSLEITFRIFTDDLDACLGKVYHKKFDHCQTENKALTDSLLSLYINKHFNIATDQKKRTVKYLGFECNKDATIIYLECPKTAHFKEIGINCDVLTSTFEDQSNLVHVKYLGQLKSLRLTASQKSGTLNFNH